MDDSDLCTRGLHSAWHQAANNSERNGWKTIMYALYLQYIQRAVTHLLCGTFNDENIQRRRKDKCIKNEGWVW